MSIIFGILPSLPPLPPSFSSFFNLSCIYRSSKKTRFFHVYPKFTKLVKSDPHSTFLFYFFVPRTSYLPILLLFCLLTSSPPSPPASRVLFFFSFPIPFVLGSIHSFFYSYKPIFLFFITSYYHTLTTRVYHTHPTTPYYTISRHINASIYQCINVNSVST